MIKIFTPRPKRKFRVTCAYCGQVFEAESDRARYCPPPRGCKQAAYRARKEKAGDTVYTK